MQQPTPLYTIARQQWAPAQSTAPDPSMGGGWSGLAQLGQQPVSNTQNYYAPQFSSELQAFIDKNAKDVEAAIGYRGGPGLVRGVSTTGYQSGFAPIEQISFSGTPSILKGFSKSQAQQYADEVARYYNAVGLTDPTKRDAKYAGVGSLYDELMGQQKAYGFQWDSKTAGNDAYNMASKLADLGIGSVGDLRWDGQKLVNTKTGAEVAVDRGNRLGYSTGGSGDGMVDYKVTNDASGNVVIYPDWRENSDKGKIAAIGSIAANFIPGVGPLASAAIGAGLQKAAGASWGDALKGGALNYVGSSLLGPAANKIGAAAGAAAGGAGTTLGNVAAGAARGATNTALRGALTGDFDLRNVLTSALTSGAGAGTSSAVGGDFGRAAGAATQGGLGALLRGGSGQQALTAALLGGAGSGLKSGLTALLRPNEDSSALTDFNENSFPDTAQQKGAARSNSMYSLFDDGGDDFDYGQFDFNFDTPNYGLGSGGSGEGLNFDFDDIGFENGQFTFPEGFGSGADGLYGYEDLWSSLGGSEGAGTAAGGGLRGALSSAGAGAADWLKRLWQGDHNTTRQANMLLGALGMLSSARGGGGGGSNATLSPEQLRAMLPSQNDTWSAAQKASREKWVNAPLTRYKTPSAQQFGVDTQRPSYADNPAMYTAGEAKRGGFAEGGNVGALTDDERLMLESEDAQVMGMISDAERRMMIEQMLAQEMGDSGAGMGAFTGGEREAALSGLPERFVTGPGGGQDDMVEARLSPGEYVFDAEAVSALGDGSNEEGARRLDEMRRRLRQHKRGGSVNDIPPAARSPLEYLK